MKQPALPGLIIPDSAGSPSADGATAQTGRPPLWTESAQRKMARLYVYTTLPLDTIVRLVHSRLSHSAPGLESANKKLNWLLDKEPRWLHPRTESDMGRRVAQLSYSQPRLSVAVDTAPDGSARDDTARSSPASGPAKLEPAPSPVPRDVSPVSPGPSSGRHSAAASCGTDMDADAQDADESGDDDLFGPFLRQTSCLSTSTDCSTGSFRQMLPGYSEPYVRTVKRLVRRFTAPISLRFRAHEGATTWLDDDDGPQPFDEEPRPMPGDFLAVDLVARHQQCHALSGAHEHGRCPCFNQLDAAASPWVTADGLTPAALRLLSTGPAGPTRRDMADCDSFGNTVLHFLAARGSISLLLRALEADACDTILNVRNTGGQTFMHLVNGSEVRNTRLVCRLLHVVSAKGFNLAACDVYGRSLFHMMLAQGLPQDDLARIYQPFRASAYSKRDAFGMTPCAVPGSEPTDLDPDPASTRFGRQPAFSPVPGGDPAIIKEARLLELVRLAEDEPFLEDADGGNGLHCLAMATLSSGSMLQKYRLDESVQARASKKHKDGAVDSSSARLEFRYSLAVGLLAAGVDPNQYDLRGNTPLMAFAAELPEDKDYKTGPKILELLISHGADVDARNRAGETALHIAARCGRKLAVKTLVRHGASVHARDADGRSVLDVADVKMTSCGDLDARAYAHFEACRAWLSSSKGLAVQKPTVLDEWGGRKP